MITGHGDDGYLYTKNIVANFSSNVYYNGFPDGLSDHLALCIPKVKHYPEPNAESLQDLLAEGHTLSTDQVLVTNGATEAFYLIAHMLRGRTATIVVPSFAEYEDACVANNLKLFFFDWENIHEHTQFASDAVFLGNPNNPTGSILEKEMLAALLQSNPKTLFIVDEAYTDFTSSNMSLISELAKYENLIIVKSLTKAYAIPGLRLGYVLSKNTVIKKILAIKSPWSVNILAIEAGKYILKNCKGHPLFLKELLNDTKTLIQQLNQLEDITISLSHTSFFLGEINKGTAVELKNFLLNEFGLLIRDASNFRRLNAKHFRIATQTPAENTLLIKGIQAWITRF